MSSYWKETLSEHQWVVVNCTNENQFLNYAHELGMPAKVQAGSGIINTLRVQAAELARPNTLSSRFGRSRFPYHSDLAHRLVPPRFVLLRSVGVANFRPTQLKNLSKFVLECDQSEAFNRDIWYINGGKTEFYSNIWNTSIRPGASIFRYDEQVMRPAVRGAVSDELLKHFLSLPPEESVVIGPEQCLIFDNWKTLHARGDAFVEDEPERVLQRISITR